MMFKKALLLIISMVALVNWSQAQEELDPRESWEVKHARWETVSDLEGRFSVISPGTFYEKHDTLETALGEQQYHTYFFTPNSEEAENEVYMIGYTDYPAGAIPADSLDLIEALFDETQEAAVESVRGELMFSQEGIMDHHPFRYWRIDYLNGRASIRTKAILVGDRFYTIQTVSRRELGMNRSTDRFIDSFRFFEAESSQ